MGIVEIVLNGLLILAEGLRFDGMLSMIVMGVGCDVGDVGLEDKGFIWGDGAG